MIKGKNKVALHSKLFKGGGVLGISLIIGQLCSLGRNVIIARLVSPEDFGISAIFIMVIAFFEMISNLSLDRLLVQAEDGNNKVFQNVAQLLQAFRCAIICTFLICFAHFFTEIFSIPEAGGAFYALALVPLFNSFLHLDPKRMERDLKFWPGASVELVSQIVVFALAWPVGRWFGDYHAMLVLLITKFFIMMVGSHVVAERKYGWSYDRRYIDRFFTFGWPLLINGILMFGILQGDRFIMGSAKKLFSSSYDMADVGSYSAALMVTMVPVMIINRISSSLLLPVFSQHQNSEQDFFNVSKTFGDVLAVLGIIFGIMLIFTGDQILTIIYGEKYRTLGSLVGWLGILWAIVLLRVLPAVIAIAKGRTNILMKANIVRFISLTGVVFVVAYDFDIVWIVIVGIVGELAAYLTAMVLSYTDMRIPMRTFLKPILFFMIYFSLAIVFQNFITEFQSRQLQWLFTCVFIGSCMPSLFIFFRSSILHLTKI